MKNQNGIFEKISLSVNKGKEFLEEKNIGKDKLLLLGLALAMMIAGVVFSGGNDKNTQKKELDTTKEENIIQKEEAYIKEMERKLRDILCEVDGVGSVDVFISYESSYEKVVLKEYTNSKNETKENDSEGGERNILSEDKEESVVYDSEEEPYMVKTLVPKVTGVAVVAQGGDNPVTMQKINNIIKALFNIEVNKIAVVGK